MRFDRFLADLKSTAAVAAGVSRGRWRKRRLASSTTRASSPHCGQRVFGQAFTEFARRMAADYRMQQGRGGSKPMRRRLRAERNMAPYPP
jgi:hypothetical protein